MKKEYVDIDTIDITDKCVDMVDIQVDSPDNTYLLDNGILTHNSNVGIINQLTVDAAVTGSRGSFVDKSHVKNDKAGILGVNSAMIPYVGSTDGARVMFSGSQGRQSIPINGAEPPIVQTGYESMLTSMLSDSYIKKAPDNGKIVKITENSIVIKLTNNRLHNISLDPKILRSGQGKSSLNYFKPVVKVGDTVKKGQIVAEGKHVVDGTISVGTNLLCAVMQWKGYSYEDGYIISDRIAKQKLTSSAYHEIEILLKSDDKVSFINQEGVETKKGEPLLIRTSKEVEDLIGLDPDEIQQGQIITKSPGGKIISLEIYPNSSISRFPALKEPFNQFRNKYEETKGTFPKKFTSKVGSDKVQYSGILIKFKIEEMQSAELGDKISNNFGGKGVIAKIEPLSKMPRTPWGEHVDVILNPIAIVNRMNPSTLKELYTSLISKFLARKVVEFGAGKNEKAVNLVENVLSTLDNTNDKKYSKEALTAIKTMSKKRYAEWVQKIVDNDYIFPILIPPFQEPSLDSIKKAMKIVGAKEGYKLYLDEYKTETQNPVAVGWLYYKKLEQQSGIKLSARSTGMVDTKTRQAMSGKGGGQRIGEMDSWVLINHGAVNVLREFYGPLADDHVTKDQIISDIITSGSAEYRTPRTSPTKDLFDVYLKGMMLQSDN